MIRSFLRLTAADRRLLLSAAAWHAIVSGVLLLVPFAAATRVLSAWARRSHARPRFDLERTAWSVATVGSALPLGSTCLSRAWTAAILLARDGRSAHVALGSRRSHVGSREFHAWTVCDGAVVLGGGGPEHHAITAIGESL